MRDLVEYLSCSPELGVQAKIYNYSLVSPAAVMYNSTSGDKPIVPCHLAACRDDTDQAGRHMSYHACLRG